MHTMHYTGIILAHSLLCGGPAPAFFAEPVADYIAYGYEKVTTRICDIPEAFVKEKMSKVISY